MANRCATSGGWSFLLGILGSIAATIIYDSIKARLLKPSA